MAATHEGSYGGFWIRALAIFTDSAILAVVGSIRSGMKLDGSTEAAR